MNQVESLLDEIGSTQLQIERRSWIKKIPATMQAAYRKAMAGKSLRAAVNAKCQDCCCWQRAEIVDCRVYCCPLYEVRPYRTSVSPHRGPPEATTEKNG